MNIIGFNSVIMDSSATLLQNGKIVASMQEERFTRIKHDGSFPTNAIRKCLDIGGIEAKDVGVVCCSFEEWEAVKNRFLYFLKSGNILHIPGAILHRRATFSKVRSMKEKLRDAFRYNNSIKTVKLNHHLCHAASTFLVSPFETSAILVMDSAGEDTAISFYVGKGRQITKIKQLPYAQSLGALYTSVTEYLGFRPNSGEGKIMGLAPYGEPEYYDKFSKIVSFSDEGEISLDLSYFTHHLGKGVHCSKKFIETFGPPREPESEITGKHENMAASVQKVLEDTAVCIARYLKRVTGERNLCISGGVGLNSVMNARILEEAGFDDIYLIPSPGDDGTSLGACLYYYHGILNNERNFVLEDPFLGVSYTDEHIRKAIKKFKGIKSEIREDYAETVARLISEGNIVGWFQGRFEFGPRALGHRSILADPRRKDMKDLLNKRVKFREPFRPFAPAVLYENRGDIFTNSYNNPFMLFVFKVREDKRHLLPAVTHVDNTGRGQTVSRETNLIFWKLIKHFYKITGVPVVLNTSFNIRGEPIVNTPEEALECYVKTDMDYLCLGNHLVWKENRKRP